MARWMTDEVRMRVDSAFAPPPRQPVRAAALGGGGPAVGISIGFLQAVEDWNSEMEAKGTPKRKIKFPVWAAGCVGGWLTCLYHLQRGKPAQARAVEAVIGEFFREERMYDKFPCPTTFTPDIPEQISAGLQFFLDPNSYTNLVVPDEIVKAYERIHKHFLCREKWNPGDTAHLMLNSFFAPNPAARFMMSLLYKSPIPGINKLWFDERYSVLKQFRLEELQDPNLPDIYINTYNVDARELEVYTNHPRRDGDHLITMPVLCASSALPYVLQPVKVPGSAQGRIEGALIDSFNFRGLHQRKEDLNEIWVSRIVDYRQIKRPQANLLEALNNLIMLYAGTTSSNDVRLFANSINQEDLVMAMDDYLKANGSSGSKAVWSPKAVLSAMMSNTNPFEVFELPVDEHTDYRWSLDNLRGSVDRSRARCREFIEGYNRNVDDEGRRTPQMRNVYLSPMTLS